MSVSFIVPVSELTGIAHSQGTLPDDVVNQVCNRVRAELEKKDMKKYINSILTAHVMKRPADHEAGLDLLLRLRGRYLLFCP